MSGIFGFSRKQVENATVERSRKVLEVWNRQYGRDGSGTESLPGGGIGCHLEHFSAAIPVSSPVLQDGDKFCVIDALLYNREELLEKLRMSQEEALSDEELLFRLILREGYDVLAEVNGDFSGAIYEAGTWTLFRDHLGVRPLYYYMDDTVFAFSTDIRGLMALPGADLYINEEQLYLRVCGYNDFTALDTDFEHIQCIPPASWCEVQTTGQGFSVTVHPYWKLGSRKTRLRGGNQAYIQEMRRLVTDAIQCRAKTVDGPIGGELSGGLDSGVIAIILSRMGYTCPYVSWSMPLDELPMQPVDERQVVEDICQQEKITCEYQKAKRIFPMELIKRVFPSGQNTLYISRTAHILKQKGVKVIFTGQGGDEGVSHRCNPLELWYHGERIAFFREIYHTTKGTSWRFLRAIKRYRRLVQRDMPRFLGSWYGRSLDLREYAEHSFLVKMKTVERPPLYFAFDPAKYVLNGGERHRLENLAFQGAGQGMRYLTPFLDYRVMDFAVSIPRRLYYHKGVDRWIYRQTFDDLMPQSLREVNYKDFASTREFVFKETEELRVAWQEELFSLVDAGRWKRYVDVEKLSNLLRKPEEELTAKEKRVLYSAEDQLIRLALIQNLQDNAGKWVDEHDEEA